MFQPPQPINKNNALNAEHVSYLGTTGSCKTTAIRKLGFIKKSDQVLFFDPYEDHSNKAFLGLKVRKFTDWGEFYRAAWKARKGTGAFRLAMVGKERTPENLELFARIAWSLGNGNHKKRLHTVVEELAKFTKSAGKLDGVAGELWTGGRGFGLIMHTTFQRGQEVPKTVLDESAHFYIGAVGSSRGAKYVGEYLDVPVEAILSLQTFRDTQTHADYILKSPGIGNWKQHKIDPRK
ncbi:hypothetical protein [Aliivibrio kagoshimensis]|uniref:hypothetical protein n=1 Tax=Aliivibrio kagoshimensis TaxID=2910230 RepID=UPI003D0ED496